MHLTLCPNPSVDKFLDLVGLTPGKVNKSAGEHHFPGGKGVHVALALKELGEETHLTGFWGGPSGIWIREECHKQGIPTSGTEIDGWTRTCITLKPGINGEETEIREKGPRIREQDLFDFFNLTEQHLDRAVSVTVSGSWPDGTPGSVYRTLKNLTSKAGVPLWIDASGKRLKEAVSAKPYGFHINRKEAESLFGFGKTPEIYADKLLEQCTVSAVTDGANGLFLAKGRQRLHARCPVDRIISSVGSGDCLLAGLVSGFAAQKSLEETARLGVACGAANCIRPELGMLYRHDVLRFLETATVEELTNHE